MWTKFKRNYNNDLVKKYRKFKEIFSKTKKKKFALTICIQSYIIKSKWNKCLAKNVFIGNESDTVDKGIFNK